MFSNLPRGSYMDEHISKDYGKEVLLSNWQERRQGSEEQNDCIVPGLQRVNACEQHLSEVRDNFAEPWSVEEAGYATRYYLGARNEALHNFKRNREVQLRFPLAADMLENCTTTYKIMYDILPHKELEKSKNEASVSVGSVPSKPQDLDLMLSYGNRSTTGRRCQLRAESRLLQRQRMQTTYAAHYDAATALI
ncbi:uncharacterized protein LOC133840845 [Drosophila sulfurigaster albostrigata]|uniref:uncharacterized protein LOC133840845 n=1 Tax=Drosophila sulfurigaster albostrigata TaxID=89887 RepID=UPI002D21B004|nr:uncharacterized protein LOC133840845 [Drosophila sulfurigaster albostrigata]